jgi:hypothetical protein
MRRSADPETFLSRANRLHVRPSDLFAPAGRTNVATGSAASGTSRSPLNPWFALCIEPPREGRTKRGGPISFRIANDVLGVVKAIGTDRQTGTNEHTVNSRRFVRSSGAGIVMKRCSTGSARPLRADVATPVATFDGPCRGQKRRVLRLRRLGVTVRIGHSVQPRRGGVTLSHQA